MSWFSAAQLSKEEAECLDVVADSLGEQGGGLLPVGGHHLTRCMTALRRRILIIGGLLRVASRLSAPAASEPKAIISSPSVSRFRARSKGIIVQSQGLRV